MKAQLQSRKRKHRPTRGLRPTLALVVLSCVSVLHCAARAETGVSPGAAPARPVVAATPAAAANQPAAQPAAQPAQGASGQNPGVPAESTTPPPWDEVERLVSEDKMQAALDRTLELEAAARADGDAEGVARGLITAAQLRMALHGYETAVEELRGSAWPEEPALRSAVEIFYAETLVRYLEAYGWEIRQRERVVADDELDLKRWTQDQILEEAHAAFWRVWQERATWGTADAGRDTVAIEPFLEEGDYPERIRGTMRDRVTYLWTALLANSGYWTPRQSNEVHRLELDRLLDEEGRALRSVVLARRPARSPAASEAASAPGPAGSEEASAPVRPLARSAAGADHPLLRLAAILADLQRWHESAGRLEAAFEAERERHHRVWQAFSSSAAKRAEIRRRWSRRVEAFDRNLPWWSMGAFTRAEMLLGSDDVPAPRAQARTTALEAAEAHPASVGGRQAEALARRIEAPEARIEGMWADATAFVGAPRRSFEVHHKNLDTLYFRAWKLDVLERLGSSQDYNLLLDHQAVGRIAGSRSPDHRWSVELPPTPDFEQHRTFVEPPLEDPGLYLILASNVPQPAANEWKVGFGFLATDLVMVNREVRETVSTLGAGPEATGRVTTSRELTVRLGTTGEAVAGASVELWRYDYQGGHRRAASATTDAHGIARFEAERDRGDGRQDGYANRYFTIARHQSPEHGPLWAVDQNHHWFQPSQDRSPASQALLYTDRSIYRPGQTLHWKVVAYRGRRDTGAYAVHPEVEMRIELRDVNGEVVETTTVTTNSFGSASGELEIPGGRLLGHWSLRASLTRPEPGTEHHQAHASVLVEEYKRPTFEVTVEDPEAALRLNRPATLTGSVKYYFGLPVTGGAATWRVTREPVYPWWWHWLGRPIQQAEIVAQGEAPLDADGRFRVEFTPVVEEVTGDARDVTYRYRLDADVTDDGGETRSASRVFHLGFVTVAAQLSLQGGYVPWEVLQDLQIQRVGAPPVGEQAAGELAVIEIRRADLDGTPRPGDGRWELFRLEQPERTLLPAEQPLALAGAGSQPSGESSEDSEWTALEEYRTPGDLLRPRQDPQYEPQAVLRLWSDGERLAGGALEHGDDGIATVDLRTDLESELRFGVRRVRRGLRPGAYRLRYTTTDAFGAEAETQLEFVVAREGRTELRLPAALWAERSSVPVGGTARLLVHSGLPDQPMLLEVVRDDELVERRRLQSSDGLQILEIPITEALRGGFGVRLVTLRDHQLMLLRDRVFVPWSERRLQLTFETFRDTLRPGQTETWRIRVATGGDDGSAAGEGATALAEGAAELLAYMYDRSLDLFAPHQPPSVEALYPTHTWSGHLWTSLGPLRVVWQRGRLGSPVRAPRLDPDRLEVLSGYGIGGPGRRAMWVGTAAPFRVERSRQMLRAEGVAVEAASVASAAPLLDERKENEEAPAFRGASPREEQDAAGRGGDADTPAPEPEIREDFSETAFWRPHLVIDPDAPGDDHTVAFEFTVPDSVTDWNVWVHGVTRDLRGGSLQRTARTVKELLVRPALPRFLREGDRAELVTVVNNTGEETLSGELVFDIVEPETEKSLLEEFGLSPAEARRPFRVEPGRSADLGFPIVVPPRVGTVAFRVVGTAGDLSDGELRPLPILPGRFHLRQSRFTALRDAASKELRFPELASDDDPTRIDDQLVVTLDAQLFYSVLSAVPYLVSYPYECTEQTLNRFLSTGILSSLYDRYPAVGTMAARFAERDTRFEAFDGDDPNRSMLLEETPWLQRSRGHGGPGQEDLDLIPVLDPEIAAAHRKTALRQLAESQTSLGGFPWFAGGRPSPYMTLYVLEGISRGLEFEVAMPPELVEPMARRAWGYLQRYYVDEVARRLAEEDGCCVELVTYLNYVLSSYEVASRARAGDATDPVADWTGGVFTAEDRERMLDHSFRHWREHSPRLKALLALTLDREQRAADAELVIDSIMDSAKTDDELGTYWAPEDRSWLWYNDTIESHAFILRALAELEPEDARRHGLVQWLFLNKKLNHWKSTRATAEVLYALVHYLRMEGQLGAAEAAAVTVAGETTTFRWQPDEYTGKGNQLVLGAEALDSPAEARAAATVTVSKETPGLLFASATWHFSTERLPAEASSDFFGVERVYYRRTADGDGWRLEPLAAGAALRPGDQVEVQLSLRSRHAAEYVHLRDPRGAGFEPESLRSGWSWDLGLPRYEEVRDSGTNFFFERLPVGEYTLTYRLRATTAGTFKVAPATVQSMYAPEFAAYSSGATVAIEP